MDGAEPGPRGLLAYPGRPGKRARVVGGSDRCAGEPSEDGLRLREQPLCRSQSGVGAGASAPAASAARRARPVGGADVAVLAPRPADTLRDWPAMERTRQATT